MAVLWASVAIFAAVLRLCRSDRSWLVGLILGLAVLRLVFPVQYLGNAIIWDWWHPCAWLLGQVLRNDLEIQCHKLVCKKMDKVQRAAYYGTVLQTLKLSKQAPRSGVMQLVGAAEKKNLKHRIHIAFTPPKKLSKRRTTAIVSLCLVTFILSYFLVFQPAGHPPTTDRVESGYSYDEMAGADRVEENEATPHIVYMFGQYQYTENGVCTRILSEEDLQLPEYADLEIIVVNVG